VAVLLVWSVVTVLGLVSAGHLTGRLTTSLAIPGTPSARADALLSRHFHENVDGTFSVVVSSPRGFARGAAAVRSRVAGAASFLPGASITQSHVVGRTFYATVSTTDGLVSASAATAELRDRLHRAGLRAALVTGAPALEHDIGPVLSADLRRGVVVAVVAATVLLVAMLGLSWAVVVPFLVAGATTSLALLIVYGIAQRWAVALYVPNVIELIGLGLAIDYSLLIVHRFRFEARDVAVPVGDAVARAMGTAARTVVTSGTVVAAGLVPLLFVRVPFVQSLGVAALVVPLVAVLGALTLQPALVSLLGRRGVAPAGFGGALAARRPLEGFWAGLARAVLRRRRLALAGALVLLAGLAVPAAWLRLTPASESALPASLASVRALDELSARFGPGAATPLEVVLDTGRPRGAASPTQVAARLRLARAILTDPGVELVAIGHTWPYVGGDGRYEQLYVVARDEFGAPAAQALVARIRAHDVPRAALPPGTTVQVGGAAAQGVDFLGAVYGAFPWLILATLAISYLLLVRAFRSVVLPLVTSVMVALSLGAAYGVMVAVFRFGFASSLLGTYRVAQIEGWVPVFLFALLFGLSMDYQVFIVARAREAREGGAGPDEAIIRGLGYTGGVVSAAAVIMVGALAGLVIGRVAGLQELGVGVAAGVLADVLVVRGVVLPSVMGLLGRWTWWIPAPVARVAKVPASPLSMRDGAGTAEGRAT
jgi:putative drug exporter of the RND superfamily